MLITAQFQSGSSLGKPMMESKMIPVDNMEMAYGYFRPDFKRTIIAFVYNKKVSVNFFGGVGVNTNGRPHNFCEEGIKGIVYFD